MITPSVLIHFTLRKFLKIQENFKANFFMFCSDRWLTREKVTSLISNENPKLQRRAHGTLN